VTFGAEAIRAPKTIGAEAFSTGNPSKKRLKSQKQSRWKLPCPQHLLHMPLLCNAAGSLFQCACFSPCDMLWPKVKLEIKKRTTTAVYLCSGCEVIRRVVTEAQ
jgi:hypothetical protein